MSIVVRRLRPSGQRGSAGEVPPTLVEPAPRVLGVFDQLGLWGNLGVSLLGFTGAAVVLQPGGPGTPQLSLMAALLATVVGTVLGAAAIAASAIPGAQTGAPAMVLLRGLLGARVSYLPTVLNIVQMVGWGTFELVTIATAAATVLPAVPQWIFVVVGGVITTGLSLYPLGAVRVLRRYVTVAVVVALAYLFFQLLAKPLPPLTEGTWSGFSIGVDTTVAVAVSWVPMAADYARHSRSSAAAFTGAFFGYGLTQIACYALGLLALVTVAADGDQIFAAFIAVPLGGLAFAVLAIREMDQSFANVYSATVSTQNVRPRWDRRYIAVTVGVLITVLALGGQHLRLRQLPVADRFGVRAAVRGAHDRLLLLLRPAWVGPDVGFGLALGDARAVGAGLRHLPADLPGSGRLVGAGLGRAGGGHRLRRPAVDERLDLLVRRRGGADPGGRRRVPVGWSAFAGPADRRRGM